MVGGIEMGDHEGRPICVHLRKTLKLFAFFSADRPYSVIISANVIPEGIMGNTCS